MDIYVHKDGQQIGPFTQEQLLAQVRHGIVTTGDLAWHEGLPDWKPVGEILASELWEDTDMEEPTKSSSHAGSWWRGMLSGVLIAGIGGYLAWSYGRQSIPPVVSSPEQSPTPTVAVAKSQPAPISLPSAVVQESPAPVASPKVIDQQAKTAVPVSVVQSGSDGQRGVTLPSDVPEQPTPTAPSDAELFYIQARALDKKKDANKSDIDQSMALYRKSVDLGNTLAMVALADLLRREDSKQHKAEVDELCGRAASLGNPRALLFLSEKAQTAQEYLSIVTKATVGGSMIACQRLKQYYSGENYMARRFKDAPEPNPALALQWEIVWQHISGSNGSYSIQQMMRKMSAEEIQIAQREADDFIAANHISKGEPFETRVQKLAFYANPQATGAVPGLPEPVESASPVVQASPPPNDGRPVASATSAQVGLSLDKTWQLRFKQEERAAVELRGLLSSHGKANVDLEAHPELTVYKSVTYLMPFTEAIKVLNLSDKLRSKVKLGCPGWPVSSFDIYGFDGLFDSHYNRLFLVVDRADHVVAVELVDESPKGQPLAFENEKGRLFTYDFVQYQYRVDATCRVTQEARTDNQYKSLRIDSRFYGRTKANTGSHVPYHRTVSGSWSYSNTVLTLQEDVRLYLPQPIIDLVLFNTK